MVKEADKIDELPGAMFATTGDPVKDQDFQDLMDGKTKPRRGGLRATHGATVAEGDNSWCRANLRANFRKQIKEALLTGDNFVIRPVDYITVDLLARNLAHISEIDVYLGKNGVLDRHGDPRNALKYYGQFMNAAIKLCDQLCITPKTRIQLGLNAAPESVDLAQEIRNAKGGNGNHK